MRDSRGVQCYTRARTSVFVAFSDISNKFVDIRCPIFDYLINILINYLLMKSQKFKKFHLS